MQIYSKTDKGLKRNTNQDVFFAAELEGNAALAIVCDGMGGANAGNIASETAAKSISEYIIRSYRVSMDFISIEKMLKNAIDSANMEIYDMALKNENFSGMGTTVVICLIKDNDAVIAHVGDSRAYLKNDKLTQITRDHSVVQSLLESGKISKEDARVHPRKNVITRALGAEENVMADVTDLKLKTDDIVMLCTDGLSSYVSEDEIFELLQNFTPSTVNELVDKANANGGGDNITVVTLKCC